MRICFKGVHFNGCFSCYIRIMVIQTFKSRPSSHSRDVQLSAKHCVRLHVCLVYSANWRNRKPVKGLLLVHTLVFHLCQPVLSSAACDLLFFSSSLAKCKIFNHATNVRQSLF